MQRWIYLASLMLGLLLASNVAWADSYTFSTEPGSGTVSGTAGSTVGWGYSITNNSSTDFLELVGNDASAFPSDDGFGTSLFDFPIVAPGATATEAFDEADGIGLFEFTWNAVPADDSVTGTFGVDALFCDPTFTTCVDAGEEMASFTANLIPVNSPEPSALLLLLVGLATVALWARRRSPALNC